jgi:hypothetical protein
MAINVSFGGATIYRPGSYSQQTVDLGGGFPLSPAGLIAVLGEADAGTPGANEVNIANNRYNGTQLSVLRNKYRSGPIADAAGMLFAPSADAAIPNGAQSVWFYKTNASVRATLALASTYATVRSREWGIGGNRISFTSTLVNETAPTHASSAAFDESALTTGDKFGLRINGGAINTFTLPAIANNAALVAALAAGGNWSSGVPSGITITVGGVDGASTITFTLAAAATQHQLGWGRSFELSAGSPNALPDMNLVAGLKTAAVEPSATLKLDQKRDNLQEEDSVGGAIVMTLGHDGSGGVTSATVTIDADSIILNQNASPVFTLAKSSYTTLQDLVNELNIVTYGGWTAAVTNALYNNLPLSVLDHVVTVGALGGTGIMPARIKKDSDEVTDFFEASTIAEALSQEEVGLPNALVETLLSGGAKGATTAAEIVNALTKFEKFHVNFIVPLFSRDASDDIADGLTDSASTYTIAGVHQSVKTHISLMKTVKRKSERQGFLSLKASYIDSKEQAGVLADARIQLLLQDIRQSDAQGAIKWFQPWALACLMAGARSGTSLGEPLTFKFLNCSGLRHTAQAMSTPDADIVTDFDPDLQGDDAIENGITFLEAPQTGGFRVVVDNTTYNRDANFLYNRGHVVYAADLISYNYRNAMELRYIGRKNTVTVADVTGTATSILATFRASGLTVQTPDAPSGYKNVVVRIEGSTIYTEFTVKIVEGIDFVLSEVFVQRANQ